MDVLFVPLANVVGASVDQIKLISCLLISYPLGSVFIRLPSSRPDLKHLFNVVVTTFYVGFVLNLWTGLAQLLGSILATYFIAKNVQGPRMPWIVFAVTMGHLMINHGIRAFFNWSYETFEVTGPQMVLTMKLTTFAWNVYDGRRPASELDKWQTEKRVVQYPSLLAFLGYAFYFPGFLVGPYLEYASYASLIDETLFTSAKGEDKAAKSSRRVPKGRKRVAYRKMVQGLVFLGTYVTFTGKYNYEVVLSDTFASRSLLYRIAFFQLCGFFDRTKYYAIWTLTEGASILTGLGFTGYSPSGASLWAGAANVNIPQIELASSFKVMLDSWNMKTNIWLRETVYKRVTPPGKKPGFRSSMITFATSAFWHGIAGGYYLAFFFGGFVQTVGRLCRANIRPLFLEPAPAPSKGSTARPPAPKPLALKPIYDVLGIASALMMTNYAACAFMLLSVRKSLHAWANVGCYGHVMIIGAMAFFYGGGTGLLRRIQAQRVKKVEAVERAPKTNGYSPKINGTYITATPSTPGTPSGDYVVPPVSAALAEVEKQLS